LAQEIGKDTLSTIPLGTASRCENDGYLYRQAVIVKHIFKTFANYDNTVNKISKLVVFNQTVNKEPFTQEEIAIIYYMHDIERIGWANIARRLGNGRMPNSCKNVYHNVVAKSLPKAANRYKELYNAITANKKELTA